jgi:hypothetical protein
VRAILGTILVLAGVFRSGMGAVVIALPMISDSAVSAIATGYLIGGAVVGVIGVILLCGVPGRHGRLETGRRGVSSLHPSPRWHRPAKLTPAAFLGPTGSGGIPRRPAGGSTNEAFPPAGF